MKDRYGVIGNPIEHSKSPEIHRAFAAQTGQSMEYERILGSDFERDVRAFFAAGGRGMNVTVPYKEAAWRFLETRSRRAESARAVNTIIVSQDGRLWGDNTDGIGLVRDLESNHGADLHQRRILLLGAGGAARGVLRPLLECQPAQLTIANRTASTAIELAAANDELGNVVGVGFDQLPGERFDLVINATAAGLQGAVPAIPDELLSPQGWCYDLMYADTPTVFVRWGQTHGAAYSLDGLGMLVEQAAEAFFLWRGVRPETSPVLRALRAHTQPAPP